MDTHIPQDLGRYLFDLANNGHAQMTLDAKIKCVLMAYDKALEDKRTLIPTALHAALEALRKC